MTLAPPPDLTGFHHEAVLYDGDEEFMEMMVAFLEDAVASDEPTMVMVDQAKIDRLRQAVGDRPGVSYVDMSAAGRNPARIIQAWSDFVRAQATDGRARGIGEPVWAERTGAELAECRWHEHLLNLVFADLPAFWLICPYDTTSLPEATLEGAFQTHPFIATNAGRSAGGFFADVTRPLSNRDLPPAPSSVLSEDIFDRWSLRRVRAAARAAVLGTPLEERGEDLALAVGEVATNSVVHGEGTGNIRIWRTERSVVCEIRDRGQISDPMVGRLRPANGQRSGYGLWLANQLCDLLQIRSDEEGTTVRLHLMF